LHYPLQLSCERRLTDCLRASQFIDTVDIHRQAVFAKASIALRVDANVLEWFKAQGPGYQTRINAVLRAFRDASL
jgi:uncharacterized protein (DUF4415 family)